MPLSMCLTPFCPEIVLRNSVVRLIGEGKRGHSDIPNYDVFSETSFAPSGQTSMTTDYTYGVGMNAGAVVKTEKKKKGSKGVKRSFLHPPNLFLI